MWWMYYCPNCRAQVAYGHRFCSSCGFRFNWPAQQITPNPSSYSQSAVHRDQNQYQGSHTNYYHDENMQHKNQQVTSVTTPISTEILKLINELFYK